MKRILTVVGARPQFIKAAAISHVIRDKYSDSICEDILHTGQHYDDSMSGQFFEELDIPQPKYNLGVGSASHGKQTALMLSGIEEILLKEQYDGVLVYGDTNSTLAGALAAAKLHIPVYHVEAGLRSFNRDMPEEINRVVTDHVATLLFAPTQTAVQNLRNEGFKENQIIFSGDVMLDNVRHYTTQASLRAPLPTPYILVTIHRDFNTDNKDRLNIILSALNNVCKEFRTDILFPIHPRTKQRIDSMINTALSRRIHIIEPLSYLGTLGALRGAQLVLTDSGGLQKEAYFSGKPTVVLRPETEWVEILAAGAAMLADGKDGDIVEATQRMWNVKPSAPVEFGDGYAAEKIIESIFRG